MVELTRVPLYVRLATDASRRLERAAEVLGKSKRQIVEEALSAHLDDQGLEVGRTALWNTPPEVLTLKEAAAMLRVSRMDLEEAAAAGRVPARRIGGKWRFTRAALLAWLGDTAR